jgi:small subunit ribosomal protein S2
LSRHNGEIIKVEDERKKTMSLPTLSELLQSGVHFGHQKSRWHPKMKPYLFTERNGIYIIDLEKTLEKLKEAAAYAKKTASGGGLILFVGTKKQGQKILEKYAKDCGMP